MDRVAAPNGTSPDVVEADDTALVVAAQADRQVFGLLYERYVAAVYRYCFHRLGEREAAEDATSLVFTRALGALSRYQPASGSFRSWLFAITHNTVADDFRRARPVIPLVESELTAQVPGPEAQTIAAQELGELRRLLQTLPVDQRRVMELRLSGLSSPEAGRILDRSPTAIRSLQFRAIERLRAALSEPSPSQEPSDVHR